MNPILLVEEDRHLAVAFNAIWKYLNDLILGRMPRLDHDLLHYD